MTIGMFRPSQSAPCRPEKGSLGTEGEQGCTRSAALKPATWDGHTIKTKVLAALVLSRLTFLV